MRSADGERVCSGREPTGCWRKRVGEQRAECDFAEADAAFAKEPTTADVSPRAVQVRLAVHGVQLLVMNSSRLSSTRATVVQAARSLTSPSPGPAISAAFNLPSWNRARWAR